MLYFMLQDWMWITYELNDWDDKFTEDTWTLYNHFFFGKEK